MQLPRTLATLLLAVVPVTAHAGRPQGGPHRSRDCSFEFAVIADTPYGEDNVPAFDRVIDEINDSSAKFVLHLGDIKAGSTPCSDERLTAGFDQYDRFEIPFVLTLGDNEWTDCHRAAAGGYTPLERLSFLRELFFPVPGWTTPGKPMKLDSQALDPAYREFPENTMFVRSGVVFVQVHLVGSHNALNTFAGRTQADDDEVERRTLAALSWLHEAFDLAAELDSPGVFVSFHANPSFEAEAGSAARVGFDRFLDVLEAETIAFGKPVVGAHGDSHYFRIDKPLLGTESRRRIENFTRFESFGSADVHWVMVSVDPANPNVFEFSQRIVEDNLVEH